MRSSTPDLTSSYAVVHDFILDISFSLVSAFCGSFQKSADWVIFSSSWICSSFRSTSKMPPQRLLALHQFLHLFCGDHIEFVIECLVCKNNKDRNIIMFYSSHPVPGRSTRIQIRVAGQSGPVYSLPCRDCYPLSEAVFLLILLSVSRHNIDCQCHRGHRE